MSLPKPSLQFLLLAMFLVCSVALPAEPQGKRLAPLHRVVDLDVGESQSIELSDGKRVTVKLVELRETRDPIRNAVREALVKVEVDGRGVELVSGNYNLPKTVGNVQIDCSITKGYNSNGSPEFWALDKDARLRLWPAGSPLVQPGTFGYPAKQRWFAGLTQMANEPVYVDGGEKPQAKKIYYHSGLDIGGCEGMVEVVAATDGLVVSSGLEVLPEHRQDTPVSPRYDVVYLLDARGWYYRYSHMKEIDPTVKPGRHLKLGDRVGSLGKEGGSGGWSHLHFEIKSRQPSGRWGTEEGYAFLWEAYQRQHRPQVIAVARPHHVIWGGEQVRLDGAKSWSANGAMTHEWRFEDGTTARGASVMRSYPQPGSYSEILKVTDDKGQVAYDFAIVQVLDREHPDRIPPTIHPAYSPTQGIRAGDELTFKVRTFRTTDGSEVWDFGDGSPTVEVRSDGNVRQLDPNGYAVTTHRFEKPGHYLVRVERANRFGMKAIGRLDVQVAERMAPSPRDTAEVVRPFRVQVDDAVLVDLRERLARTRWPDELEAAEWDYGVPLGYLRELSDYWRKEYDWRKHEAALNALPQFVTTLDGVELHFLHVRSQHAAATPLVLVHGWPGSVWEFHRIIPMLTDPTAHGGRPEDAFHVVIPSLPGFGFSGKPKERGWSSQRMAETIAKLMARLGYTHYGAQGGDWGSGIVRWLAANDGAHCIGAHSNFPGANRPMDDPLRGVTQAELDRFQQRIAELADHKAYGAIQGTRRPARAPGLRAVSQRDQRAAAGLGRTEHSHADPLDGDAARRPLRRVGATATAGRRHPRVRPESPHTGQRVGWDQRGFASAGPPRTVLQRPPSVVHRKQPALPNGSAANALSFWS